MFATRARLRRGKKRLGDVRRAEWVVIDKVGTTFIASRPTEHAA
jgi:hypothetical protein